MGPIYLDSSAAAKLVWKESESAALRDFLRPRNELFCSRLVQVEVGRIELRRGPGSVRLERLLRTVVLLELRSELLEQAARLPPAALRSLDAIHLATALSVPGLRDMVVYDSRLSAAAEGLGLRVWAPR
ncbi:MAG TPA: type II toxin-antitoxin system VapC family toxin [Terriglobales bacterium]|nr:type II toxin-antitoxin system VapC family toxin [Terriglobales bacterium]